ncbi:hypothetical protein HNO88_004431 [Novosphingobium chloroacetimidivorans]|uniref:Ice-binding protein C-terminal domain-containing protein n=1 Tax=Novosphingobium chloroacetimidivorans TaxID=1428314 RepID=A0A7W7KDY7_9SPHN|nr:FxDxF family PEP-CTERM protein [Novosphingobium chloroacetimidivorans]MBB4861077.1 hypothetical protein [Novosphingobium chloroacetimidivorans]
MRKLLAFAAAAAAISLCGTAGAATFSPDNCKPGDIHFCVNGDAQAPDVDNYITGFFTNTFSGKATKINDTYSFIIDKNGVGSGGIQTSFSSKNTQLVIEDLIINGNSYAKSLMKTAAGTSAEIGGINIVKGALNTIQVIGSFKPLAKGAQANYTGNLTFTAAVPEASTWAMMIMGIGFVGFAMRRKASEAMSPTLT